MRSRSNSGVRLDIYHRIVEETILRHQDPVTGLLPASPTNKHAWIRDNVYSIIAVWGLSMAYKKIADADEDRAKTYELQQSCVKLMRGLLMSAMKQREKLEKFKVTKNPTDSLHAKYSSENGQPVVGDDEWGHLQIDAISLYLLILAQMTASGLQIVFNTDEVTFVQNLVFYIESAYCIPDYGIWERGDKSNQGLPELNASSIGMAKAALEAMNELDLFGARGGPNSTIHVMADEAEKCQAVLQSMLPRESGSKEVDSGLLSVIGFPAFAVDNPDLIQLTRKTIVEKLQGRYGCKRFLRDGYKTAKEDPSRLYYEPWELRMFENIECEWPLFFCYLMIDACFRGDREAMAEYCEALDEIMIRSNSGMNLVPELYTVPAEKVAEEYKNPGSQDRVPLGRCPFMWAQSLYIIGKLLQEGFLAPGELDPLNRRLGSEKKPDVVVQVVILAEDEAIQEELRSHDISVLTVLEVQPIEVQPARVLSKLFTYLGKNNKLGLSGRKSHDVGILSTSRLYTLQDRIFAFTPQYWDALEYYMHNDYDLMTSSFMDSLDMLSHSWRQSMGRPTVILLVGRDELENGKMPMALITTMKKLKSGYTTGTRVILGNLNDFLHTSCITSMSFLSSEDGTSEKLDPEVQEFIDEHLERSCTLPRFSRPSALARSRRPTTFDPQRRMSHHGSIRRSRSIAVNDGSLGLVTESKVLIPTTQPKYPRSPMTPPPSTGVEPLNAIREVASRTPGSSHQFQSADLAEMLTILKETENLEEQGDILHLLMSNNGLDFVIEEEGGESKTVKEHLKTLYEKACREKMWGLVRHTAGMLGKRVEDLAKAVCDILVRQKQVTFGMPPNDEIAITAPLPESELRSVISQSYGGDRSTAMLTQELIVYLGMFIRTEPHLFNEMLRLRVGLIIQVMVSELARSLDCTTAEASEHLINFSPFEMKNLLLVIISGKEFGIRASQMNYNFSVVLSKRTVISKSKVGMIKSEQHKKDILIKEGTEEAEPERQGQWLRRRKLDGALNRAPKNFYPRVWSLLERCQGLIIADKFLPQSLTQEMTSGELKFALQVEIVLNSIPQPEYRQLIVEALMVLTLLAEYNVVPHIGGTIEVEQIVHKGNQIFLEDQMRVNGDATLCCARPKGEKITSASGELPCKGPAYICLHFYDSAPSGNFGTMTYLMRASAMTLDCLPQEGFQSNLDEIAFLQRGAAMEDAAASVLSRAVEMDSKKRFTEALVCYQEGLQLLMDAIKSCKDEAKRSGYRKKASEYMDRAEKLKQHIEKEKEQGLYHEQIHIENNATGFSYKSVLGSVLDEFVNCVEVEDPYVRAFHQCQNFLRLCELLVKSCPKLQKIVLVTGGESSGRPSEEQLKRLNEITESLATFGIVLTVTFSETLHDREIRLDTGWVIKIGRGLDYFKPAEGKLRLGACDMDLRRTHETTVDIFHRKNVKLTLE